MDKLVGNGRDWFLKEVIKHLRTLKIEFYRIEGPDHKVKWSGTQRVFRPRADIWLESNDNIIIVEIDNDSDPVRSLIKYWPRARARNGMKKLGRI